MFTPLDPKTEKAIRDIAIGKTIPTVERDKFRAGEKVQIWPDQIMTGLRVAYLLGLQANKGK